MLLNSCAKNSLHTCTHRKSSSATARYQAASEQVAWRSAPASSLRASSDPVMRLQYKKTVKLDTPVRPGMESLQAASKISSEAEGSRVAVGVGVVPAPSSG